MVSTVHLTTAPTADVVTLEEAKAMLRIVSSSDDALVAAVLAAAVAQLDPATGGWLGRALRPQTWSLRMDRFPDGEIILPYPPLISVDSFVYDSDAGVETTMTAETDYRIFGSGALGRQRLVPPWNDSWPIARLDNESVRITFTCGYPRGESIDALPTPIKQAILLMVRHLYALGERSLFITNEVVEGVGSRQYFVPAAAAKVMQEATDALLGTYRVWNE